MTRKQFDELCKLHPYYRGRWGYYSAAMTILRREGCREVLEIGPASVPLVPGSQVMQFHKASPHVRTASPTYVWDATQTPWPIGDKRYDAVVALQVWEHLQGRQQAAFAELRRVARFAVLSFPYRWKAAKTDAHHDVTDDTIATWTMGHPIKDRVLVPDDESPKLLRIVCSFAFADRPRPKGSVAAVTGSGRGGPRAEVART